MKYNHDKGTAGLDKKIIASVILIGLIMFALILTNSRPGVMILQKVIAG